MSYNISSVETRDSTLRISEKKLRALRKLELPEQMEGLADELVFGEDGYAPLADVQWSGEGSGRAFVALTEGGADLILTWEGGDSFSGVRIKDGAFTEHEVIQTLGPKVKKGARR